MIVSAIEGSNKELKRTIKKGKKEIRVTISLPKPDFQKD